MHKEGCEWKDIDISLYANNQHSDDSVLSIDEYNLMYNESVYSGSTAVINIRFNFCPVCGTKLT